MGDEPSYERTAEVYDLVYAAAGKDYAAEATAIDELIRARRPGATSLLDVACGTGAHLEHLRSSYDDVVGVDLSPAMLARATERLGDVPLVVGDMRTLDLGRTFDAVVCLFSAVGHMRTTAELDAAVASMARHLVPGGVLVVDGWIRPDDWRDPGVVDVLGAVTDDGLHGVAMLGISRREGRRSILEMHHLVALVGDEPPVAHLVDRHELTLFEDDEYRAAFERAGLAVEVHPSPHPERDRYVGVEG